MFSLFFSAKSTTITKGFSFLLSLKWVALYVGIPISVGITAYAKENEVFLIETFFVV